MDEDHRIVDTIKSADLAGIRKLVLSGINVNRDLVLGCDKTTPLGLAAHAGDTDIVEFLIQSGAQVNYRDSLVARSALHWACIGAKPNTVEYLLKNGAKVNGHDRDKVTPLIALAMNLYNDTYEVTHISTMLIEAGSEINGRDRLNASALHYATFSAKSGMVRVLIQNGCTVSHRVSLEWSGTPLLNLLQHEDFDNVRLLILAGYPVHQELTLIWHVLDKTKLEFLLSVFSQPSCLKSQCRIVIRRQLTQSKANCFSKNVRELTLPKKLIDFIYLS